MDGNLAATYTLIHAFLTKRSHTKVALALKKAARDVVILKDDVDVDGPQLDEIIKQWKAWASKRDLSGSGDDSSSGSDSSSEPSDSDSDSSDSDSDSDSSKSSSAKAKAKSGEASSCFYFRSLLTFTQLIHPAQVPAQTTPAPTQVFPRRLSADNNNSITIIR
ncbi:hypothetical protein PILCRDRAFT_549464 [Piloderma croceum F 1598]|uniref:LisH domain-containing protein n=1 Tax=Piloderma croceum (strain F 1598) TaxID=765440 RepID=A0A0C3F4J3_PILCF|nr:hypothetical protein PILCRDRAFT_549464 [Piloderma croceum F 1598]